MHRGLVLCQVCLEGATAGLSSSVLGTARQASSGTQPVSPRLTEHSCTNNRRSTNTSGAAPSDPLLEPHGGVLKGVEQDVRLLLLEFLRGVETGGHCHAAGADGAPRAEPLTTVVTRTRTSNSGTGCRQAWNLRSDFAIEARARGKSIVATPRRTTSSPDFTALRSSTWACARRCHS